jgi:hypothetical protein
LHERGLEGADHPLAVGVRRAEATMVSAFRSQAFRSQAFGSRYLISRP